jgi:hypothetical protein
MDGGLREERSTAQTGRTPVLLAGELVVVGDQAGESSSESERSGVGAFAVHRPVLGDCAGDGDEPSGGRVEDDRLLIAFELVADDSVAQLGQWSRGLFAHPCQAASAVGDARAGSVI